MILTDRLKNLDFKNLKQRKQSFGNYDKVKLRFHQRILITDQTVAILTEVLAGPYDGKRKRTRGAQEVMSSSCICGN